MKLYVYELIIILPPGIFLGVSLIIILYLSMCCPCAVNVWKRFEHWVFVNLFSDIIKEKPSLEIGDSIEPGPYEEPRLLLKDIDITNIRRTVQKRIRRYLWSLAMTILFSCGMIFWNFLLLDTTFSCDDNDDNTKDCFGIGKHQNSDPVDCNSAAVQNGTVQVVCYKIVFNFGIAAGASYGTFRFTMAALNAATSVMLFHRKLETVHVCRVRIVLGVVFAICYVVFTFVIAYFPIFVMQGHPMIILQMAVVFFCACIFLFLIPWKDLVSTKNTSESSEGIFQRDSTEYNSI